MLPSDRKNELRKKIAEIKAACQSFPMFLQKVERFGGIAYQILAKDHKKNFALCSPSIYAVLAMCALGADGDTASELYNVLQIEKEELCSGCKILCTDLKKVSDVELVIANKIVVDRSLNMKYIFTELIKSIFSGEVKVVDFAHNCKDIVEEINNWYSRKVKNVKQQFLTEDYICPATKMMILNAVYVKVSLQFNLLNENQPFFVDTHTAITIPMIHRKDMFLYKNLDKLNAEFIAFPCSNHNCLLIIMKPKKIDGLPELRDDIQKQKFDLEKIINVDSKSTLIDVYLPKFYINNEIDLNKHLGKFGVNMMMGQTNFTGITDTVCKPPFHINEIVQKFSIEINNADKQSFDVITDDRESYCSLKVDRPFIWTLFNKSNNLTLFSGHFTGPN